MSALLSEPGARIHGNVEVAQECPGQPCQVPVLGDAVDDDELIDQPCARVLEHLGDRRTHVRGAQNFSALLVDHLALVVRDIVEQEQLLADVEVVRLDLALRFFDLTREHAALDDFPCLHAGELQQPLGAGRIAEDAHQIIFHRQVEAARSRVALTPGTPAQLVVDASRFVTLGAYDVQATGADDLIVPLLPCLTHGVLHRRFESFAAAASRRAR